MGNPPTSSRIGLALAGGGPLGAIYEVGALCALDEALRGIDFVALDGYVGVSAGSFIAAGLANGISPRQMCRAFIENDPDAGFVMSPTAFVHPAWAEYLQRLAALPALLAQAGWRYTFGRRSLLSAFERLGRALPTGVFSNAPLEAQLRRVLEAEGRSNDFRKLGRRLIIVATDLDSSEPAPFGLPGWDQVPISQAVQASAALPGLFPPVRIGSRHYVDGALKKTLHARVLLDRGVDLMLCLNPLVPFDAVNAPHRRTLASGDDRIPRLVDGGLPVVLSQTFRALIHSRVELGLRSYETSHPDTDIVLFEPDQRDPEMFLANIFSYSQRRVVAEHAYQRTRADLRERAAELSPVLARHGIAIDEAVLADPRRRLVARRVLPRGRTVRALKRLELTLGELERALPGVAATARRQSPR